MGACRESFGVTFHENMSVKEITETWIFKVPAIVKGLNPTLDNTMTAAYALVIAAETAKTIKETAVQTYKDAQDVLETAVAVTPPTADPAIATTKASKIAADAAAEAADAAAEAAKAQALAELNAFCVAQLTP